MIAQELVLLVPDRILSLTLMSTFACGLNYKSLPKLSGAVKIVAYVLGSSLSSVLSMPLMEKELSNNCS